MTNKPVTIRETIIDEALSVHKDIPEFNEPKYTKEYFEERCKGKDCLIIVANAGKEQAGYLVAYNKLADGSFYCWMVGVIPKHRQKGVLTKMMEYLEKIAKSRGYSSLKIKTRNTRREMLTYLIKHGFNFIEIIPFLAIEDNRILLEKQIQ
ncbi:GNAT family N-acetyltransferase [Candidatus Woesearchaeota archaeon]|nr:GNAT family N-acetyltransferase [Candidatus Woesearchaeota archaeon]